MKANRKVITKEVTHVVNKEGESLDVTVKEYDILAGDKEEFFLCFVSLLSMFKEISGPSIKVFAYLLLNNNSGVPIAINKGIKEIIAEWIKIKSIGTIDNALLELTKNNMLIRKKETRGVYMINPRYAFYGSKKDRDNKLLAVIRLGCKDC